MNKQTTNPAGAANLAGPGGPVPPQSSTPAEQTPEAVNALTQMFVGTVVATTVDENALTFTPEEQAIQDQLKDGSGENEAGGWNFIPYITINNKMVKDTLASGREVDVRCLPEFCITEKDADKNYITSLFAPEFEAVIIKFMHRVQRKIKMDQTPKRNVLNTMPFFRSLEFKSFQSDVHVRVTEDGKGKFLAPMSYSDVKKWAGDELELWSICYFLIPGENIVRKAEFKGASRGILYDYMTKKRPYSVSSVITKFSAELDSTQANPYNRLVLTNTMQKPTNLQQILDAQKELKAMIDGNLEPSVQAEEMPLLPDPREEPNSPNFVDDGIVIPEGEVF